MLYDHIQVFWKDQTGWKWMETSAFTMKTQNLDLSLYIESYISIYIEKAREDTSQLSPILQLASIHRTVRPLTLRQKAPFSLLMHDNI